MVSTKKDTPVQDPTSIFLCDQESRKPIPLETCRFEAALTQGHAALTMHQFYSNESDTPLETLFLMPNSDMWTVNSLEVTFTLQDGSTKTLVTRIDQKEQAQQKYSDAVASGKTAVISTVTPTSQAQPMAILRIMLGNFPPRSRAYLKAQITSKLDLDDQSYCFKLPMSFVPPYMGSNNHEVVNGVNIVDSSAG